MNLLLTATLLVCVAWLLLPQIAERVTRVEAAPRAVVARGELTAEEKTNIEIFETSKSSVVYISTLERVVDFWTRNVTTVPRGTGSGFIWDEQGHVITNRHVIAGAAEANVRLADGRDYTATLVGASATHDIAVLRILIPTDQPAALPIGASHDLRVGQKVFAIGNPFGLDWTLTTGIVSALDRSLNGEDGGVIQHLIQTDAAINPGNRATGRLPTRRHRKAHGVARRQAHRDRHVGAERRGAAVKSVQFEPSVCSSAPGAINIPYTHLPAKIASIPSPTHTDVIVYCEIGVRAEKAASSLRDNGFQRLMHLDGDMKQWREAKRPAEK